MRKFITVVIAVAFAFSFAAFCLADKPAEPTSGEYNVSLDPEDQVSPEYAMPEDPKAYSPVATVPFDYPNPSAWKNVDNGIVIGQPKLFELRSLQMMIDNVKASLAQTSYPDPAQLFAATGRVQGAQGTSSSQSLQVTRETATDGEGAATRSAGMRGESAGSPNFGFESPTPMSLSPTDVLAEQTSLWHQLVNLQMLLDGALSDRLIPTDESGAATVYGSSVKLSPRAQAIIGFQISVDSRIDYRNAVAEAIITIDNKTTPILGVGGYGDEPSLMMLLPRNKTYNTVSLSKSSKSFGMGSIANVISMGFGHEKTRETFYIGKDTDTVALERIPNLPIYGEARPSFDRDRVRYRGVSFGWQFRPVFTKAAVEPGVRQVFAMVSLPASVLQDKWEGKVHVTTYWRKYDRSSGAVGKPIASTVNEWDLDDIVVPIGSGIEDALQPSISRARWEDAGEGKVAVTMEGSNFAPGAAVACGESMLEDKSLSLLSPNRIRFVAPASAVARGDITVIGRYGIANLRSCIARSDDPYKGIEVASPRLAQQDDQTTAVELILSNVQDSQRLAADRPPVVLLDGELFGAGGRAFTSISANETEKSLTVRFSVPTQMLVKARELVVRDLIGSAAIPVRFGGGEGSCIAEKAVVLSAGSTVSIAIFGSGFKDDVKILMGETEAVDRKLNSSDGQANLITFTVDMETALSARYILLTQDKQAPVLIPFSMTASVPARE